MADQSADFQYLVNIVESIQTDPRGAELGVRTSMHNLVVASMPVKDPPVDVIVVYAPQQHPRQTAGNVMITHASATGREDRIERPFADAVPLFWRFAIEKFGVPSQI